MGMSASQARYLGLTARRNNNEFQAQQINQQRLNLADKTEEINKAYTDKMSNTSLLYTATSSTSENTTYKTTLTYSIITNTDSLNGLNMRVVDKNGNVIVPALSDTYYKKCDAIEANYETEKARSCFTGEDSEGKSILFTGNNFISNYMSGLSSDVTSIVKDKNNNDITLDTFKTAIQNMTAADFYDYWTENGLQYTGTTKTFDTTSITDNSTAAAADRDSSYEDIEEEQSYKYFVDENCNDSDYLEKKLRDGEWFLQARSTESSSLGEWVDTMWQSNSSITDAYYTADDAAALAEYETAMAKIQKTDKQLELELKQLDTEHSALQTEMDSVKKVIEKNVESSFKTFA